MHIVVYGGCVPRKSLGAGAVGGRARVVARERRVILLLFVASVAFGRCERCDDVTCLLVVTRTKFVIVTFFYTLSGWQHVLCTVSTFYVLLYDLLNYTRPG